MVASVGTEHRAEPRYQISHEFIVTHPVVGKFACMSEDLSLEGVFLIGDFSGVEVGSTVEVSFLRMSRRPGADKGTRYYAYATVIRINEVGAGLKFQNMKPEVDAAIYDLMHRRV